MKIPKKLAKKGNISLKDWLKVKYKTLKAKRKFERAVEEARIGVLISKLRVRHRLTQKQLAKILHTKQQYISRIEQPDNRSITVDTLIRIGRALNEKLEIRYHPAY